MINWQWAIAQIVMYVRADHLSKVLCTPFKQKTRGPVSTDGAIELSAMGTSRSGFRS